MKPISQQELGIVLAHSVVGVPAHLILSLSDVQQMDQASKEEASRLLFNSLKRHLRPFTVTYRGYKVTFDGKAAHCTCPVGKHNDNDFPCGHWLLVAAGMVER